MITSAESICLIDRLASTRTPLALESGPAVAATISALKRARPANPSL